MVAVNKDSKFYSDWLRLIKSDQRYGPSETRNPLDLAMVFVKRTNEARLFKSLEQVSQWYNHDVFRDSVFLTQEQLGIALSDDQAYGAYKHWYERVPQKTSWLFDYRKKKDEPHDPEPFIIPKTRQLLHRGLWEMIQQKADRVTGAAPGLSIPESSAAENLYVIKIDRLKEILLGGEVKLAKQARAIAQALLDAGATTYIDKDMETFMLDLKRSGTLKTKQDAFRVFQYYAPALGDLGAVYYNSKRHKQDDYTTAINA